MKIKDISEAKDPALRASVDAMMRAARLARRIQRRVRSHEPFRSKPDDKSLLHDHFRGATKMIAP